MTVLEAAFLGISLGLELWIALKIQGQFFPCKGKKLLSLFFALLFFLLADILGIYFNNYLIFSVARLALFLFLFHVFYEGKPWIKLSMACLIIAIMDFTGNIFAALLSIFNLLALHRKSELLFMDSDIFISCFSYLCAAIVTWSCFKKIKLKVTLFSERYGKIMFVSICGLILLTDIVNFGISRGVSLVSNANGSKYWNPHINELLTHLECIVLSILSISIILSLTVGINRMMQYTLSEQIHHAEVAHYKALLEEYHKQTHLRHDIKNHMIGISALIETKDYGKLEQYIEKMYQAGSLKGQEIQTGNTIIDAIMNIKQQKALKENIPFACEMNITKEIKIEDFDLCILLGNLLDNAIHAEECIGEKKRYICVRAEIVKRNFIIEVRNAYYGKEKSFDTRDYGTGLWNVKNIVEQNGGIMDISIFNTEFCVSAMLPIAMH